jgi:hypothetical protein
VEQAVAVLAELQQVELLLLEMRVLLIQAVAVELLQEVQTQLQNKRQAALVVQV